MAHARLLDNEQKDTSLVSDIQASARKASNNEFMNVRRKSQQKRHNRLLKQQQQQQPHLYTNNDVVERSLLQHMRLQGRKDSDGCPGHCLPSAGKENVPYAGNEGDVQESRETGEQPLN